MNERMESKGSATCSARTCVPAAPALAATLCERWRTSKRTGSMPAALAGAAKLRALHAVGHVRGEAMHVVSAYLPGLTA